MKEEYSVLVVDDEESIRRLLQKELTAPHRRVQTAASAGRALELCRQHSFEVILLDIRLQDGNGLELLPVFLRLLPDAKIIMITGYADVDGAVTAMRNKAYDFVTKPFTLEKLELIVERAFEHTCLERENRSLRLSSGALQHTFIGRSPSIQHVSYLLNKVAPTDVPVLITGDSGTGKAVVAAEIHRASKRAAMPFVVKNCACLQKDLARSELFGHVRGAFTGALDSTEGLMTFANKGTLFLDEVGELPLEVQSQLLRILEDRCYRRVGEKEERSADVRFLFATNRNLAFEAREGNFHEALFHRLNVFQITLPSLRERRDDIAPLVSHFLALLGSDTTRYSIEPGAMRCLMGYHWPGNVRELRNVIERGIILAENGVITERALPRELVEAVVPSVLEDTRSRGEPMALRPAVPPASEDRTDRPSRSAAAHEAPCACSPSSAESPHRLSPPRAGEDSPASSAFALPEPSLRLDDVERGHIAQVLAMHGGNKRQAAKTLGITRKTLYRKLDKLALAYLATRTE